MTAVFDRFATGAAHQAGTSKAFIGALTVLLLWTVSGPVFGYSDTWQLIINTGTTIVTFLMVFLIQHAQNKDALAIHAKLDELIRAQAGANDRLVAIEQASDDEVREARQQ